MPAYPWILENNTEVATLPAKLRAQRTLGVPYPNWSPAEVSGQVAAQSKKIAGDLKQAGAYVAPEKEIVALIAYLQSLGKFESVKAPTKGADVAAAHD